MSEDEVNTKCRVCKEDICLQLDVCARIERGDFQEDRNEDNIKYEIYICKKCFLEDEDLCKFFNKIGDRVR